MRLTFFFNLILILWLNFCFSTEVFCHLSMSEVFFFFFFFLLITLFFISHCCRKSCDSQTIPMENNTKVHVRDLDSVKTKFFLSLFFSTKYRFLFVVIFNRDAVSSNFSTLLLYWFSQNYLTLQKLNK